MSEATEELMRQLIRLAKGMLTAWERWLTVQIEAREKQRAAGNHN